MSLADSPALSTSRSLYPQQIDAYHRDGFLIVRGVFQADEMAALAAESDTLHRSAPNQSDQSHRQLYLSYNAARDGGQQRDAH